ncbi:MAG: XRE family transcriptional regulator [Flavobacteriia bacterium]|nr:XRE family transcriptional regulator [Flavobacteriia bacterium]
MNEHNNLQYKVSKKIKNLRIINGYTSYETFANDYDLDRKQYWRIENGSNITLKTLDKILSIHKISVSDFFKDL